LIGNDMKELDQYTYGNSDAAIALTKILNGHPHCIKTVSRTWGDYTLGMRHIEKIESPIKYTIMTLWRDRYICIIKDSKRFPDKVRSYFANIVTARFRIAMKEHVKGYGR